MNANIKAFMLIALVLLLFFGSMVWANETGLVWSTFLGGSDAERGLDVTVDHDGCVYVTGQTQSADFPTTTGAFDTTYNGGFGYGDVYVVKINLTGNALDYATFLGGSGDDAGYGVMVDDVGNAYVTGFAESYSGAVDFPTTAGAFDESHNGYYDVFVAKLNQTGDTLDYATFLGGSDYDLGYSIALDGAENAYVIGRTGSANFPTTAGAFDITHNGSEDVFVAKLNPEGSDLDYATFLGGSLQERGYDIVVDDAGNAYITGRTNSDNFPATYNAFDIIHNGGRDVFVTKLSAAGDTLRFSTFLGGADWDWGNGIAADESGNVYVTGRTYSIQFPTTGGAFDRTHNGGIADAFVVVLDPTGKSPIYGTFLGGSDSEGSCRSIAMDSEGNLYMTGFTHSANFPTTTGAFDNTYNGGADGFFVKFNPLENTLVYGTFLGGSYDDLGYGLAVDSAGNAYVIGDTWSPDFPTTPGAFDVINNGVDAFVAKLGMIASPVVSEIPSADVPKTNAFRQNYPNPFNESTKINYQIPADGHVTLKVFNALGQEVRTLVDVEQRPGEYEALWDGRDDEGREAASGLYFCRLKVGEFGKTIKMVLMR